MRFRLWGLRAGSTGGRFGAVGIVLALVGAAAWVFALNWRPSAKYPFQGVDVSEANGAIDWYAVHRSGADFAYLRATSGAATRDTRFAANWADVRATGMRRGAYHAYSLCRSAADQANNFNTTVPREGDALPAAVELAFTPDCLARPAPDVVLDEVRRFATMVETHTGRPVLLKVAGDFERDYHITAGVPRPIWAVQDFFPPDYAARAWRMWQATDMRRIDGVDGAVHWDVVAP